MKLVARWNPNDPDPSETVKPNLFGPLEGRTEHLEEWEPGPEAIHWFALIEARARAYYALVGLVGNMAQEIGDEIDEDIMRELGCG